MSEKENNPQEPELSSEERFKQTVEKLNLIISKKIVLENYFNDIIVYLSQK